MKRGGIAVLLALLAVRFAGADERILSFQSDIQVLTDGSMEVVETILVRAEGRAIKRGIYRDFPTIYRTASGNRMRVGFQVIAVRRDGKPEDWFPSSRSNGIRVYLGQKDRHLAAGQYSYEITYRTNRQLGYFDDHDELYWNVTGNGWSFPIEQVVAFVYLPRSVPGAGIRLQAYTGKQGARGRDFGAGVDEEGVAWFSASRALAAGEGLTIVTSWPKGHVREPSSQMYTRWFLEDNAHLLVGLLGCGLLLSYYLVLWLKVGRDPDEGVVFPRYRPPPGYSPASMRYIRRMGYDHKTFAAALVNLAVNGHITIDERDGRYSLERHDSAAPRAPGEQALLDSLLGHARSIVIQRSNHARIVKAIKAHRVRLSADYERIYFNANLGYTLSGVCMSLAMLIAGLLLSPELTDAVPALFLLVWLGIWTFAVFAMIAKVVSAWRDGGTGRLGALALTGFTAPFVFAWFGGAGALWATAGSAIVMLVALLVGINAAFYHLMKAPTLRGRELLDRIAGFREYLGVAEQDELSLRNPPRKTPELFEALLPYAIALDVEEIWGDRFARTLADARVERGYGGPRWYHSSRPFSSAAFGSAVGGLSASIASSSHAPGSSSASGGGGSSGGGGGGGGGGGW